MERKATIEEARSLFGENFIGLNELEQLPDMWVLQLPIEEYELPWTFAELESYAKDYLLIMAVDKFVGDNPITIANIKKRVGVNPDEYEPCLYNQDWYDKEDFVNQPIQAGWFLIRKNVFDDSRAVAPNDLELHHTFPTAIQCAYAFFTMWYSRNVCLWRHDFVWCSDKDHNGDRIYVGKYNDIDGVNKNGFSIHRHLALRPCYAAVDIKYT